MSNTDSCTDEEWLAGFKAGWQASGEGYNGECPDEGVPWEQSAGYAAMVEAEARRA